MEKKIRNTNLLQRVVSMVLVITIALLPQMHLQVRAATTRTASDWSTFQTALNDAQDGDTIQLTSDISGGATELTFLADGRRIIIASSVAGTPRVISQNNINVRHLNITGTGTASITFTDVILDGKNVGGGLTTASNLTLNLYNPIIQNCVNSSSTDGAGINMGYGAKLNLYNGRILNNKITNTAQAGGGVLGLAGSILFIEGSIISGNSAGYGGGVYVKNNSIITISNTTVENNNAVYTGGGVYSTASGTINIINSKIDNNTAGAAGGIFGNTSSNITITDSTISNNVVSNTAGGGILAGASTKITLNNDTTIIGNKANNTTNGTGGGIGLSDGAMLTISANSNVKIVNNTSGNNGAGIGAVTATYKPTINIYSGLIDNNQVTPVAASGGGVWAGAGTVNFTGGTISNNKASVGGGIAVSNNGKLQMSGGTITNNSAPVNGGGIYAYPSTTINITGGIISNNSTSNNGGGIFANSIINISGDTEISGNTTPESHYGGGICLGNGSTLTLPAGNHVKIINNHSGNNGGGISTNGTLDTGTKINIADGLIDGNIVDYGTGGGIFGGSGTVNFSGGTIRNNSVYYGGGIGINTGGTINMSGGTIENNVTTNAGGGIYAFSSSSSKAKINITGGTISNNIVKPITGGTTNTTDGSGGGIFSGAYGIVTISNATIDGNQVLDSTRGFGGGIFGDVGTTISVTASKIMNNMSKSNGGGIYGSGATTIALKDTTQVTGNTAPNGNGGGVFTNALSNLYAEANVLFAGNSAKQAYFIKDSDKALHMANIQTTQFSVDTGYGYNNYDIGYIGDKVYVPFTISIDASTEKIYKPNWAPTTAKIRTVGTMTVDSDNVQYMLVPTTDSDVITTKEQFEAKAASVATKYKGKMHQTEAGSYLYNMYSNNDPDLNGVLENGKLWVMATGTNTNDDTPVVAFDTHTFTNIYTPMDVYHQGKASGGNPLYAKTRVGVNGNLDAVYGIPLDLDGTIIANPIKGYDTINVTHKDLEPLWTFNATTQEDIQSLVLNDTSLKDQVYTFTYDKNVDNWFSATFQFEDDSVTPTALAPSVVVDDFISSDTGDQSYMFGMDLYMPPVITGYDPIIYSPIGYKIDGGDFVPMSFPLKYGEIVLTADNQTVTIVYSPDKIKVVEEYHLYERDASGVEQDKGEIGHISANTTYISDGDAFVGLPPHLDGYVYRGYSVDGVEYNVNGYPVDPYATLPTLNPNSNTKIIYKYKVDTNRSGFADEDVKRITVTGTGIDARGQVVGLLYDYQEPSNLSLYDTLYTPNPQGTVDFKGNTVFVDTDGVHWILSKAPDLYSVDAFRVTEDKAIKFYYYKDTSGNGVPDYLEANITIQYWDEANGKALASDYLITEYAPTESFSRVAPTIPGFIAVGVVIHKSGEAESAPMYVEGIVKGEINPLNINNWIMKFLYQPDANDNGIPDNAESMITIKTVYKLLNGEEEINQVIYTDRHGETLRVSADSFNKDPGRFEYTGGMVSMNEIYTFVHGNPQVVSLNYKEKKSEPAPIPEPTPDNDNRKNKIWEDEKRENGVISVPEIPNGVPTPIPSTPEQVPSNEAKDEEKQNTRKNNFSWGTFEKPEKIFIDGELIPLNGLIYNGPYIYGYPDKTVGPNRNLTRAEAAQIIYNLYGQPDEFVQMEGNLPYKDVNHSAWYAKAVAFLTQYHIVLGYPDGMFYPNKSITRAELVTLLVKYKDITDDVDNENVFDDVVNHWAKTQINAAYRDNILTGYPDGTFKPNDLTTRSEVVTIVNKMLGRPDQWIGTDEFSDLSEKDWAYRKLMNAANGYAED